MVPLCSDRITRVPSYSSSVIASSFRLRGYHPLWPDFPDSSSNSLQLTPTGLFPFRSPLLRESRLISFPPVTEMFQFTGFALVSYEFTNQYSRSCGLPHSEIHGSKLVCQLPVAYRRLQRPSSPCAAKASAICAYSLDHITPRSLELMKLIHICANATYPKDDVHRLNMGVKTKKHFRLLKSSARRTRPIRENSCC
jgi:hypothetical protein